MLSCGDVFGMSEDTHGVFQKIPEIENCHVSAMTGGHGTMYIILDKIVCFLWYFIHILLL